MKYSIQDIFIPFFEKLEFLLSGKFFRLKVTLICLLGILIFTPPAKYFYTSSYGGGLFGEAVIDRSKYILNPPDYGEEISHESKTYFRIFIPIFCKVFSIEKFQILYVIQNILGIFFMYILSYLTLQITKDRVSSLFICLSITFLYVGRSSFHDISGWFDPYAYFFLLCCFLKIPGFLKVISLNFAFFTDERSILSAFIIGVFFCISFENNKLEFKIFKKETIPFYFSIFFYFIIRFLITHIYGFKNIVPDESLHLKHLTNTFWGGLEGNWILFAISTILLFKNKSYTILFFCLFSIIIFMIMTLNIGDQTRSFAYIFPIIFIFLFIITCFLKIFDLRFLLLLSLFITLLYPADFCIDGFHRTYTQPIYIKMLKSIYPTANL